MIRLQLAEITGLFGKLNHRIDLHQERGITILHGANGTGKTTILKIISQLSRGIPSFLANLSFREIRLGFEDSSSLLIRKLEERHILLEMFLGSKSIGRFNTKHLLSDKHLRRVSYEMMEYWGYEQMRPLGDDRWLIDDNIVHSGDLWEHISIENQPHGLRKLLNIPNWLDLFWKEFNCTLIEEQRLLRIEQERARGRPLFKRVVQDYADKMKSRIKDVLGTYAESSQQLDRTFPTRVVDALEALPPDASELLLQLDEIEQQRDKLHLAGLIEKEAAIAHFDTRQLKKPEVARILSVYAQDAQIKLKKFDDIYRRVTLFEALVNSHFVRKSVKLSKDRGLQLITDNNETLDPAALSSGEQHVLVLFYELIFGEIREGHLVLIDEPELSLHPAWQLRFIDDLEKIRGINRMDFVLATHSPQIIGRNWDLTRELAI